MSRMFGTDGVRGIANSELTAEIAFKLGKAGALVLFKEGKKPNILVGTDTRISKDLLENALTAGILSTGANVIFAGEIPTPAIAYLTKYYGATAGVVISASHNPFEYNGIKFFDENGYKLSDEIEDKIQEYIENDFKGVKLPTEKGIGQKIFEKDALKRYIDHTKSVVRRDLRGKKIMLDCANGAVYRCAEIAFKEMGAEVLTINDQPNGININLDCGSTHPENLMKLVVENKCDMGFAFDGDADRCLAVDEKGNLINGDAILLIIAKEMKERGELEKNTLVVTVMSNLGLHHAAKREGINIEVTKVGDRYVLENMSENGYVLGGEQSGHILLLNHNSTGDGLATALKVASCVAEKETTLSEISKIMKDLPQVLLNVVMPSDKMKIHETDEEIIQKIKEIENKVRGNGRLLIRASGTEPLIRIMMEGTDIDEITKMSTELLELIKSKID